MVACSQQDYFALMKFYLHKQQLKSHKHLALYEFSTELVMLSRKIKIKDSVNTNTADFKQLVCLVKAADCAHRCYV